MSILREDCLSENAESFEDYIFDYFNQENPLIMSELIMRWHRKESKEKFSIVEQPPPQREET